MSVRWLHISDVHECEREHGFRRRMYLEIVEEVGRHPKPDLVFLTGDMAFAGTEREYLSLEEHFISPLKRLLPDSLFFTVPGNHDMDRRGAIPPRIWIGDPAQAKLFQSPDEAGARKRREVLLPRFESYAAFDGRVSSWGSDWLRSETGAVWWAGTIGGTRVSVIGMNTAWLCQDDENWGKLTPGRFMLERALDEAQKDAPDLLIVLGHHPIMAMGNDGPITDAPRVIDRLKQSNALYLHGHLHASGSDSLGTAERTTLSIQAPSAFQAHDGRRWRNGLMWGAADASKGALLLEPRLWNEDKREYKFDIDAGYENERVPGRDAFQLQLPRRGPRPAFPPEPAAAAAEEIDLPQGWEIVDRAALARIRAQPPSEDMMVAFFDGILPTWRLAIARGVQPRAIVQKLSARLRAAYTEAPKPVVLLVGGPGGEGKSTTLLQVAAALIEDEHQTWTCLHRQAAAAPLPEDLLARLPVKANCAWIVVIDDADNIGSSILAAVKRLGPRTDVHLLLAARDVEWQLKELKSSMWLPAAAFQIEPLSGLDSEDAARIVAGWHAWGDRAMGPLKGRTVEQAAAALLGHAIDLAAKKEEGALLGALLFTRQGQDIRAHVSTMVHGLGTHQVIGKYSLRDIYAMVAAMHSENQLYLSIPVLAFALGCEPGELERRALWLLRREAMLDNGDVYVLTRHRRIAEAACATLREDHYDIDSWYPFLANSVRKFYDAKGVEPPNVSDWTFELAEHFVRKGKSGWITAVNVARAVYDADRGDIHSLNADSSILRRTGRAAEAAKEFHLVGERVAKRRDALCEWATAVGMVGDHTLSIWIGGRSLADLSGPIDQQKCMYSLLSLHNSLQRMFSETEDRAFLTAQSACGQLGVNLRVRDADARRKIDDYVANGRKKGVPDLPPAKALEAIRRAVVQAANEVAPDKGLAFEELLGDPGGYKYSSVLRLMENDKGAVQSARRETGKAGRRR